MLRVLIIRIHRARRLSGYDLVGQALQQGLLSVLRSVILDHRVSRFVGGIPGYPRWADIADQVPEPDVVMQAQGLGVDSLIEQADKAINFIEASAKLSLPKGAPQAIRSIVQNVWPESREDSALLDSRLPTKHFLVSARLRFDATMCLTMQSVLRWVQRYDPTASTYRWFDGIPTCGFEAYLAWEQFCGHRHWERLLQVNCLGFGWMGINPKIFSLLFKFWVETGDVGLMRYRLALVKGIVTDFGTESKVVDSADLLPEFLELRGWRGEGGVRRLSFCSPMPSGVAGGTTCGTMLRSGCS